MHSSKRQRGAFLVISAIVLTVLVGLSALALDAGRMYALRSEMQNAVDAAALAGAAELDGGSNAQDRAKASARYLLQHDSRFASVAALLGPTGLPDSAFTFYCIIGAQYDPAFSTTYCSNTPDPNNAGRYLASADDQTHYVRVTLDPSNVAGYFRLNLIFLPVLSAIGVAAPTQVAENAHAIGGRSFYTCDTAIMAICDPFEGTGTSFHQAMPVGGSIQLRGKGSGQWTNGNFGFIVPPSGGSGASAVSKLLANEDGSGCSAPYVTTQPGAMAGPTTDGINTRFDQYSGSFHGSWSLYPPAPDIVNFPEDNTALAIDSRFGSGDWDFAGYWNAAHPGVSAPNGWSDLSRPTRSQVYNWEISNNAIPNTAAYPGQPNPAHMSAGSVAARRLISVAVLSCAAMQLGGRSGGPIQAPDGYAKVFLYRQADGSPNLAAWGEYIGWDGVGDNSYHQDVMLYE